MGSEVKVMKLILTGLIIALLAAFYYHLINLDQFDGELELNMEEDEDPIYNNLDDENAIDNFMNEFMSQIDPEDPNWMELIKQNLVDTADMPTEEFMAQAGVSFNDAKIIQNDIPKTVKMLSKLSKENVEEIFSKMPSIVDESGNVDYKAGQEILQGMGVYL